MLFGCSAPESSIPSEYSEANMTRFFVDEFTEFSFDNYVSYDLKPCFITIDNLRPEIINNEDMTISFDEALYDPSSETPFGFKLIVENKSNQDFIVSALETSLDLERVRVDEDRYPSEAEPSVHFYAHQVAYLVVKLKDPTPVFEQDFSFINPDWEVLSFFVEYHQPVAPYTNYDLRPVVIYRNAFDKLVEN